MYPSEETIKSWDNKLCIVCWLELRELGQEASASDLAAPRPLELKEYTQYDRHTHTITYTAHTILKIFRLN